MGLSALDKTMALRRQVRDLEQQAEQLEERAKAPLTTEEAAARFSREASAIRSQIIAQKARIVLLDGSRQIPLF